MRQSGITISKGSLDYILHNVRVKQTNNSIFGNKNIYMNSHEEAFELYEQELKKEQKFIQNVWAKSCKKEQSHI